MTVPKAATTYADTARMALGPVRAAYPVAAVNIGAANAANNWLFARGTPIAVDGGYSWSDGGAQTKFLRYFGHVDLNHVAMGLAVVMCTNERGKLLTVTITLPDGVTQVVAYVNEIPTLYQFAWENTDGNADVGMTLTFDWDGDYAGLNINNLYLAELPTTRLPADTGAVGIVPRQQIYDGYAGDHVSIAGLARGVEQQRALYIRRNALWNWNAAANGLVIGSTSYTPLFPLATLPAIQTRLMFAGETLRACKVNVNATCLTTQGNVRITMGNGDVATFTIAASTVGWQTVPLAIDVSTDDPSTWSVDGGIRGGTRDTVLIESKRGIAGSLTVYAISIWDPEGG